MPEWKGEAKLTDYLTWYPREIGERITIHEMFSHSSGLPNYTANRSALDDSLAHGLAPEEVARKYCTGALEFEPGTRFVYCNTRLHREHAPLPRGRHRGRPARQHARLGAREPRDLSAGIAAILRGKQPGPPVQSLKVVLKERWEATSGAALAELYRTLAKDKAAYDYSGADVFLNQPRLPPAARGPGRRRARAAEVRHRGVPRARLHLGQLRGGAREGRTDGRRPPGLREGRWS